MGFAYAGTVVSGVHRLKIFSRIALVFGGLFFGFLCVEGLLRIFLPANPFSPNFPLYPNTHTVTKIDYPGVSTTAHITTNKWGLRGDQPPQNWDSVFTLITMGGSTTRCTILDDSQTWAAILQKNLRVTKPDVWVGNAGIDGQTTRAHILLFNEVVSKMHPDMVTFLVGINDPGLSLREDRNALGIAADKPRSRRWKLFTLTRTGQILYDWKRVLFDKVPVVQSRPMDEFKPLTDPTPPPKDLKMLLPQLPEFERNIRTLIQRCREENIRPLFMTQPMLFADTPEWRKVEGIFYWIQNKKGKLSAATHWKLLDIYNRTLIDICRKEKVEYLDLASAIPHEKTYFVDSVHYTEAGTHLVAQKISDYLKTSL